METVTDYASIRRVSLRGYARHAALSSMATAYTLGLRLPRLLSRPRIQFLYLHHVFRDEEDAFRRLLAELIRYHEFITYSDAINRLTTGNIDRPYMAFSSDDGLKNNMRAAAILEEFGARACFFVYPSMIGEKDIGKIAEFNAERIHLPPIDYLDWHDVDALLQAGHEIGGHSVNHANMAVISQAEREFEAGRCLEALQEKCGEVPHFAWPYGRFHHFNAEARRVVFDAGFRTIASAERGCHVPGAPIDAADLCIRRDHVVAAWPRSHVLYLLARNAQTGTAANNLWPY